MHLNIEWFYFETEKLIRIITLELIGIQYINFYYFPLEIVGAARARERGQERKTTTAAPSERERKQL
jgi:hypothetical protein